MGIVKDRALLIFNQAGEKIVTDCKIMHADHSAKGLLRSGNTLKSAVRIFCQTSGEALRQVLDEVSQKVEHRGRAWKAAMAEVKEALDAHAASAPEFLEASFKVAAATGDAAQRATMDLVDKCVADLNAELTGYEAGWTAPKSRPWIERHPVMWALGLAIFSAIVGGAVTLALTGSGH